MSLVSELAAAHTAAALAAGLVPEPVEVLAVGPGPGPVRGRVPVAYCRDKPSQRRRSPGASVRPKPHHRRGPNPRLSSTSYYQPS